MSGPFLYRMLCKQLLFICIVLSAFFSANAQNAIVNENALTGNPSSEWDISGAGDLSIQGFATDISVNKGTTVHFKIKTNAPDYTITIYRLGYYDGMGARKIASSTVPADNLVITASLPQTQPADLYDAATGLTDCGNWSESAHWDVPSGAVSGIYIAKLKRTDTEGASHIVFIVRDDNSSADLVFQTSDATWQAYNVYGGNSLYTGSVPGFNHATKVSYNRPFYTRNGGGGGGPYEDWLFNSEYPMLRWLERNGYNVTYVTNVDAARNPSLMQNRKVFMSVGHDEYWSKEQRDNIEAARNNGKHLAFFSGNEVYWKTRWESSMDGSSTPYRTLVCYKEGTMGENGCGSKCDPSPEWTGLWRDGCNEPGTAHGCNPENALSGQISWSGTTGAIEVPYAYKNLRFWRNTSIASLTSGQTATLSPNSLGYEWDWEQNNGAYPQGRILMSSTSVSGKTHKLSLYKHAGGAWVFGAGTVQWSWGLDAVHDGSASTEDPRMQQATVNLFADMNVQPGAVLQSGLVPATASNDQTPPVSIITSPASGSNLFKGVPITIIGTATDANAIGGIEISTDGGLSWQAANGTSTWTYSWTPATTGTFTIKCRAFDDNGNMEAAGNTPSPNVIAVSVTILPSPTEGPGGPILVISSSANPFSRYPVEILRAEGLNEFAAMDITAVTAPVLSNYDVVLLGEMTLTAAEVTLLTNWTDAGGTLIAFKPDAQLSSLMGISPAGGTLTDKYLLVNTDTGPGVGIVNETIQFHGVADRYTLNGATSIATLYADVSTPTVYPAVSSKQVGVNGGTAIAFTYDLAKSVVYTRQGNPAWAGDKRDGQPGPIRSDDLFFGAKTGDIQPDWVNLDKVAIPQADEQQHLLANIILQNNADRMPLPKFWFLPKGLKAVVVMTGDDHGNGGTIGRFNNYYASSTGNTQEDIDNWISIRGTSYIFPSTPITDAEISDFQSKGFEIGLHLNTGCADYTPASYENDLLTQKNSLFSNFPSTGALQTNRTHCIAWSDWATQPLIGSQHGIRLDANYYYWPGSWVLDRPGMFTGSGMPMRFANTDGSLIDCYQLTTQMTDESAQNFPSTINSLLDKALGPEGYYGAFCANMHTDNASSAGSDAIIAAAVARQVPVISAKQMLNWLDARNNSSFSNMSWNGNQLSFTIGAAVNANNIQAMLPRSFNSLRLASVTKNGSALPLSYQVIKGMEYGFFAAGSGDYVANYITCITPTATITVNAAVCQDQPVSLTLSPTVTGQAPFDLIVNGVLYNDVVPGVPFATFTATENSIWGNSGSPASPSVRDNSNPIETGVKFRTAVDGYITGIRFYKGPDNSGTHTGRLWTTGGTQLASAIFTNETATGWQEVHFSTPVAVTAGQTYIASYLSPDGWFAYTAGGLTSAVSTPLITALAAGTEGPNGVYKYGGGFPDGGIAANYWVDVLFTQVQPDATTLTYTLTSITDDNGCNNTGANLSSASVTILPAPAGTISLANIACAGQNIPLVFTAAYNNSPYTLVINGNTYSNVQSGVPFNTYIQASNGGSFSVWNNSTVGGSQGVDNAPIELGVKISSSVAGNITAIRFYKTDNVVRTYTGSLWDPSNPFAPPLATASLTTDNTIGWKQINFTSPVAINANSIYIASYYSPGAYYAFNAGGLNAPVSNSPLTAMAGSVYKYGGGFPDQSSNANYWADVVFATQGVNIINLTSITDANGCLSSGSLQTSNFVSTQCASLPVTLINLTASPQGKKVTLRWTTSSEINNRGFELQRSVDGVNWTAIGFVNGAGNSTSTRQYEYIDDNLSPGKYYYRLKQIDIDNHFKFSFIVSATLTGKAVPMLGQNYPNPFRSTTSISFELTEKTKVSLKLYDVQGRLVSTLLNESRNAGTHTINFNAAKLGSGVYYYKLEAGDFRAVRKMVIQ